MLAASTPPRRLAAGRPKPLDLCSVFLLTPIADMKLDGLSLRAALKAEGIEYVFKVFESAMKAETGAPEEKMARRVTSILSRVPDLPDFLDVIKRALAGDEAAAAELARTGHWQLCKAALGDGIPPHLRFAIDHATEVELACLGAMSHLRSQSFDRLAEALAADPLIRPYASEGALDRLAAARTHIAALSPRLACLCEFLLSQVARVDVATETARAASDPDGYAGLLGGVNGDRCKPGAVLIRWIQPESVIPTP